MTAIDVQSDEAPQEGVADRVRQMFSIVGLDGTEFAAAIGVPYSTVRTYTAGRTPSAEFLAACYRRFGFMPSWVLTGDLPIKREDPGSSGPKDGGRDHEGLEANFVEIPVLREVHLSAGHGAIVAEPQPREYAPRHGLCYSRSWLQSRNLSPASLCIVQVRGSSMEHALSSGDLVLVNKADRSPKGGNIYALRQGDELLVKYVNQVQEGVLRVSSANPVYQSYDIDLTRMSDVEIIGRVVASMHEW